MSYRLARVAVFVAVFMVVGVGTALATDCVLDQATCENGATFDTTGQSQPTCC